MPLPRTSIMLMIFRNSIRLCLYSWEHTWRFPAGYPAVQLVSGGRHQLRVSASPAAQLRAHLAPESRSPAGGPETRQRR